MRIKNVKINGITNPIGYLFDYISCSWEVVDTESKSLVDSAIEVCEKPDFEEIAYFITANDLKQSGTILKFPLKPCTRYYVRVIVKGNNGDEALSDVHFFETGKMKDSWSAKWIATELEDKFHPIMSKTITIDRELAKARWYITGVGVFEAYINGKKVGDEYLMPYVTNYETNIQVVTLPVEEYLSKKENILEISLGKGWYMSKFGLELQENNFGDRMATIGELHIEYTDGRSEVINTDETWEYIGSDIEDSGIYLGETINRTLWVNGQRKKKVEVLVNPEEVEGTKNLDITKLCDRVSLPVLAKETLEVKEVIKTPLGETVLDFGQNFAGIIEFKSTLPKGTKVVFDFGEILQGGNFYNGNYRDAESQFIYISNGVEEVVEPHFTFFGFRYVRISGWVGEINTKEFIGKALYSDIERTGFIETSHTKLNKLYENTLWGLKSNFLDLPTDCPQRSERLGWTGDIQVFAPTACYHTDTRAFMHKFLKDLRDEQVILGGAVPNYVPNINHKKDAGSVWGDVATFLPNTLYNYYGSLEEVKYSYNLMKDWVDYIDELDIKRGYLFDETMGHTFGDWLALDGPTPTSFKGSTDDTFISSVYYYQSTKILKEMSEHLCKLDETKYYAELEENIKKAVLHEYFSPSGRLTIDTQAGIIIALKFGIFINREKLIEQFVTRLKKDMYEIKCGFVGAPLLCTVLGEVGLYELAYDFLLKEDFPSWLHTVNLGATTIWERWNSVSDDGVISDTGMNSLNHYAYGSVMEFVYAYVVGIKPLEAGFSKVSISPKLDIRLSEVKGKYKSVSGEYVVNYSIKNNGEVEVHIEVPFNCEAVVELPEYSDGVFTLTTGKYDYLYMPKKDFRKPYSENTKISRVLTDEKAVGILRKYTPILTHIVSGSKELSSNNLKEISSKTFLPFNPIELEKAIDEISELVIF